MKNNVMVDLETLGTSPASVIVSIGAVKFNLHGISETFYERIDLKSSVAAGMGMDPSTVLWWMKQSDEARAELGKPGEPLKDVLCRFAAFCHYEDVVIWGNGAAFDNSLLAQAYKMAGLPQPWAFWNDRCYRTVKSMFPNVPLVKRSGVHHHALDDAKTQALHLVEICAKGGLSL